MNSKVKIMPQNYRHISCHLQHLNHKVLESVALGTTRNIVNRLFTTTHILSRVSLCLFGNHKNEPAARYRELLIVSTRLSRSTPARGVGDGR
jgi:hypothetical protein